MKLDMVVEIPEGSRNKYEMDHTLGRIRLDRTLFTATWYPADYGYFPNTTAEDDDPLDALVLLDQPTFPGCVVGVRPIGVFWMHDERGPDAKILCVPADDTRWEKIHDLEDIPDYRLNAISHFFKIYKEIEPRKSGLGRGWQERSAAEAIVADAFSRATTPGQRPGKEAPALSTWPVGLG